MYPSIIIYLYIIHLSSMYLADFADYQTINPPNGSPANLIESNLTKVIQSIYVKEYFKQNETSLSTQHFTYMSFYAKRRNETWHSMKARSNPPRCQRPDQNEGGPGPVISRVKQLHL